MVTKVFVSGISASQEVRKKQQRILFILESLKIVHEVVDITEPGREEEKAIIKEECAKHDKTNTLPPQIFSDDEYLGDYSDFENATENDNILGFLKLAAKTIDSNSKTKSNGVGNGDRVTETVTAEEATNDEEGEKTMEIENGTVNGISDNIDKADAGGDEALDDNEKGDKGGGENKSNDISEENIESVTNKEAEAEAEEEEAEEEDD